MRVEDRVKTTSYLNLTDRRDYLFGEIISIEDTVCLDRSVFEKIMVKFDDGRILPCIREELETANLPLTDKEILVKAINYGKSPEEVTAYYDGYMDCKKDNTK